MRRNRAVSLVFIFSVVAGCGSKEVIFHVYQEDAGCWERTLVDRPALYWPDGGPDVEWECVNADGDCVRFNGTPPDDPWLGACGECEEPDPEAPNC